MAHATAGRSPGAAWQKADVAAAFTDERRALIPLIAEQERLIEVLLTRGGRNVRRFCDLGSGNGAFAALVMRAHPESTGVLVDFSEPMLAAAGRRLAGDRDRWTAVRADLSAPAWLHELGPGERFDAIVSSFCVHHLPDERKQGLYREVFDLLEPGGLFLNWEHVASSALTAGYFEECMVARLIERERARPDPRPDEVVEREYRQREDREDNRLATADRQCEWLREIGFSGVDSYFKWPELAVFGGAKPSGSGHG